MRRVAAYVRVSTERQATEGDSIEDQLAHIRRWADQNEALIVEEYSELGASAHHDRRPVMEQMMFDAKAKPRPFDAIVVYSQSRFYRDNMKREIRVRELERLGIEVISVTEPITGDEPIRVLVRNVTGIIAEHQSRENSLRVRACQMANARNGFFNGAKPPFGYKTLATNIASRSGVKKKLILDDEEAQIVRRIFELAVQGTDGLPMGVKRIATFLNNQGVMRRGTSFRKQVVYDLLTNRTYIGQYATFKRDTKTGELRDESDWVVQEVPPIVSLEVFQGVQAALKARSPDKKESKAHLSRSLLTGLLVCSTCGKGMKLMTGKSGKYQYYYCSTKGDVSVSACAGPNLPRIEIEEAVLDVVTTELLVPTRLGSLFEDMRTKIRTKLEPAQRQAAALESALSTERQRYQTLLEQISGAGLQVDQHIKDYLAQMQSRIRGLTEQLQQLKKSREIPLRKFGFLQVEQFVTGIQKELADRTSPLARSYLQTVVSEIRVTKSKDIAIKGKTPQLAAAVSQFRPGQALVPSFVSEWRPPPGSNRDALRHSALNAARLPISPSGHAAWTRIPGGIEPPEPAPLAAGVRDPRRCRSSCACGSSSRDRTACRRLVGAPPYR